MPVRESTVKYVWCFTGTIQNYIFKLLTMLAPMAYLPQQFIIQENLSNVYNLHDNMMRIGGSGALPHKSRKDQFFLRREI